MPGGFSGVPVPEQGVGPARGRQKTPGVCAERNMSVGQGPEALIIG